ncbi:MAG TPA: metallophosphoesterase [Candidatus Limnocylindrales bacterium]|nr:metallophosphoesterase [Candidatus Limnocylindrales bacterium]
MLHTADVHLGARHADLGDAAAAQRERQFAAFRAAVDLGVAEKVDIFLIAGDLFDSNTQPKRSVERVAAELNRLADARIRTVIIPGTHDCYDRSSIYRTYDLETLAGSGPDDDFVTVLNPDRPFVHLPSCEVVVHGVVFPTKRAPHSPLRDLNVATGPTNATWHVGLVHGALAIPGKTDGDEVVVTKDEIAATGLDYLVLADAWDKTHPSAPELMGQKFQQFEAPNRFGLPRFYTLHVWAWKSNPTGSFVNWHANISCDAFTGQQ